MAAVSLATFTEVKGDHEFSGRMIARPVQMSTMLFARVPYHIALEKQRIARSAVRGLSLEYVRDTDEYIIDVPRGKDENTVADELMATGNFEYVEPDWTVFPLAIPNDPRYSQQWHLPKIQAAQAWDLFRGTSSVIVAITDTGIRLDHEDFQGALVSGYNSASQLAQANGGDVSDIQGHGTHCAGIAAAQGNNLKGVSGAGWNFKIMPVRVTNATSGNASITALTNGARWAADNGARVVSTSYSGVSSSSVQTTGAYIKNTRNGIYLWAAGNANTNMTGFDHADVTIVGASDSSDARASFSNYGTPIDIFAPGVNIHATLFNSATSYGNKSGTSMATPCAAGVAAMIVGTNPSVTGAQAESILYATCDDIGAAGNDSTFGWGRINVNLAIRKSYNEHPFRITSITPISGQIVATDPALIANSDDQAMDIGTPTITRAFSARYNTNTTLLQTATIRLTVETRTQRGLVTQQIQLFNHLTASWDNLDIQQLGNTDLVTVLNVPNTGGAYVENGTGLVQVRTLFTPLPSSNRVTGISVDQITVGTLP